MNQNTFCSKCHRIPSQCCCGSVKEQDESFDRTASHMAGEYVSHPVKELTDEEINKLWAESHEDGIAMQQGFTTQQHYFAHLILRKAQSTCNGFCGEYECKENQAICKRKAK